MSRFDQTVDDLKRSLAWHVEVTLRLQRRLLEAQKYVRGHSGDPQLLALLNSDVKE